MGLKSKKVDPAADVLAAKIRFCKAMDDLKPLRMVEEHPLASTGCAFAFGLGLRALLRKTDPATFLPLLLEIALQAGKGMFGSAQRRP